MNIVRRGRWLVVELPGWHAVASWALAGGGIRRARAIAWHEVRDRELPPAVDAATLIRRRLRAAGLAGAVALVTSRRLDAYVEVARSSGGLTARCVATVGLSNALAAGDPATTPETRVAAGTINLACVLPLPLKTPALLEALALAAEARTAALLAFGVPSTRSGRPATGTGTDCIVMAAPIGRARQTWAGKHTVIGELVGGVVHEAVRRGTEAWLAEHQRKVHA